MCSKSTYKHLSVEFESDGETFGLKLLLVSVVQTPSENLKSSSNSFKVVSTPTRELPRRLKISRRKVLGLESSATLAWHSSSSSTSYIWPVTDS